MTILKSIGAGLTGIVVGAGLSFATDALFEKLGLIPHGNLNTDAWRIVLVLAYRTLYNVLGAYITAKLAPNFPMRHALALGALGTLISIGGALATANMNLGPGWYAWTLAVLTLPAAWLGGILSLVK